MLCVQLRRVIVSPGLAQMEGHHGTSSKRGSSLARQDHGIAVAVWSAARHRMSVMGGQFWGLRQISALDGQQRAWNVGQVHRERELQELKDGFALRDVYRKCWAGLGTKEDAEQAVNLLVDYDWLMVCDVPTATRSARQYFVNPKCAICAVNDCPPTKPTKPTKPTDS